MHHFNVLLEASYHGWATYPPMYPLQKCSFNSRPLIKGNQWVFISPDHKAGYVLLAVGRYFWRGIRRARLESPFITWREPTLRISPRGTRTNGFGWMVKRMNLGWPVQKNQQNKTAWVFVDWFEIKIKPNFFASTRATDKKKNKAHQIF